MNILTICYLVPVSLTQLVGYCIIYAGAEVRIPDTLLLHVYNVCELQPLGYLIKKNYLLLNECKDKDICTC